jgi:hypothetical protein
MAILHRAEVTPSKIELVQAWAPHQPYFVGDAPAELSLTASFRYDDPEGEVGIETLIVRVSDDELLHVPVTYRGAPLEGGEPWLIGTMEHSVLGSRWVYDATGDPAYLGELATAAFSGGTEVEQFVAIEGVLVPRESTAHAVGSGGGSGSRTVAAPAPGSVSSDYDGRATVVVAGELRYAIARRITPEPVDVLAGYGDDASGRQTVSATWADRGAPFVLAAVWER